MPGFRAIIPRLVRHVSLIRRSCTCISKEGLVRLSDRLHWVQNPVYQGALGSGNGSESDGRSGVSPWSDRGENSPQHMLKRVSIVLERKLLTTLSTFVHHWCVLR